MLDALMVKNYEWIIIIPISIIGLFMEFISKIFYDPNSNTLGYYGDKNTKWLTTSL